jgi:hypothetical protein
MKLSTKAIGLRFGLHTLACFPELETLEDRLPPGAVLAGALTDFSTWESAAVEIEALGRETWIPQVRPSVDADVVDPKPGEESFPSIEAPNGITAENRPVSPSLDKALISNGPASVPPAMKSPSQTSKIQQPSAATAIQSARFGRATPMPIDFDPKAADGAAVLLNDATTSIQATRPN